MNGVEDELSGIPRNPNPETITDGRMYPPSDAFEKLSLDPRVRLFRHRGHQTRIGTNGAIQIRRADGAVEIDKPGADGKTITDFLLENNSDEPDSATAAGHHKGVPGCVDKS
jgi:hypothetical protein